MRRSLYRASHAALPSLNLLALASIGLGAVALLHLFAGPGATVTVALGVLLLTGLGGFTLERRLARRQHRQVIVHCTATGRPPIENTTLDLSAEGFFVLTDRAYPVLTRFDFAMPAAGPKPIAGRAVVRWINRDAPKGMGVEILTLDDPEQYTRLVERGGAPRF